MKEVLTKKFWRDVKKTFNEAREESPPKDADSQTSAEGNLQRSSPVEPPPSQEGASKRD